MLKPSLIAKTDPKADEAQIAVFGDVRITCLTPRLIRVERGTFTDLASFTVWFRRFPGQTMHAEKHGGVITVETAQAVFTVKGGKPHSVYMKDTQKTLRFAGQKNLKGTCRTLDMTRGAVPLRDGLLTEGGAYLLDDSQSMLLGSDGRFVPRDGGGRDWYAFAYGKNYRETLRAFYQISGRVPLVPRFALGVWWSRYHAYTDREYLDLMDRFAAEDVPLSVATVDMDWHWVHGLKERFGVRYGGWTGYSWNRELFPDYRAFLKKLKEKDLHITLNLHPADGIHSYEDMYEDMAKAVGQDPAKKETVRFRCGSDDFWNAYFDVIHKPYEKDGVDFWWIDWQQGKKSDVPGLDPLNALNHYHFLDNAESGQMPLILSRYAGLGSHRYPLGFSGDTAISWPVLHFQPYFTANAANAAYSWWSHDIGGHHQGYRDDDLYMRWIEFGVFSPILRLHSTAIELLGKEPWKYRADVYESAKKWMRLRHKMIPYLFTMDRRTNEDGTAICEPMYYSHPDRPEAYNVPNEYMFGSELLVCPITQPQHKSLGLGSTAVWLPEGEWTDIFTGQRYKGGQKIAMFRELNTIPALARPGAIVPLSADRGNTTANPQAFEIWAVPGNGRFTLLEDNGRTDFKDHTAKTAFEIRYENGRVTFTVSPAEGDVSVIPPVRDYTVKLCGAQADGAPAVLKIENADVTKAHTAVLQNVRPLQKETPREGVIRILSRWQDKTFKKDRAFRPFEKAETKEELRAALQKARLPREVAACVHERLCQLD